jgi:hypothetical protein
VDPEFSYNPNSRQFPGQCQKIGRAACGYNPNRPIMLRNPNKPSDTIAGKSFYSMHEEDKVNLS